MSNELQVVDFVQRQMQLFNQSLSDDNIKWEKECQFAIQAFQKNEYLAKVAMANQASAQNAIINLAAIGVTLNPAAKLAYLVPRDGAVCLDISYIGLLKLAQDAGAILWGQCKLVHSNDSYENNGLDKQPTHKYQAFGDRGPVVGGYCTIKTPSGDYLTEEMSLDDIKQVEMSSKAKNGPWKTFWAEMARKTIVKRASKYWPKSDRLDKAINYLNTESGEGLESLNNNTSLEQSNGRDESIKLIEGYCSSKGQDVDRFVKWASLQLDKKGQKGVDGKEPADIEVLGDFTDQQLEKLALTLRNAS